MKLVRSLVFVWFSVVVAGMAIADRGADEDAIRKAMAGQPPLSIEPSVAEGWYEVVIGPHVVYMSGDGRYMLQGELIDVQQRVNLTEARRFEAQRAVLDNVGEDKMIVFEPEKKKRTITVFTDIDCGYCRKLHSEIDQYLDEGIEVRYLMYPRAGKDSESYRKAVAVWCAEDRNKALTVAKNNGALEMKTCDNPVDEHMQLATTMGLRGTPLIVTDYGEMLPGYVPAKKLSEVLKQHPVQ